LFNSEAENLMSEIWYYRRFQTFMVVQCCCRSCFL